jgi:hypothetical protein
MKNLCFDWDLAIWKWEYSWTSHRSQGNPTRRSARYVPSAVFIIACRFEVAGGDASSNLFMTYNILIMR